MRGIRTYGIVLLVSLLVASLCACATEEDESRQEGQSGTCTILRKSPSWLKTSANLAYSTGFTM